MASAVNINRKSVTAQRTVAKLSGPGTPARVAILLAEDVRNMTVSFPLISPISSRRHAALRPSRSATRFVGRARSAWLRSGPPPIGDFLDGRLQVWVGREEAAEVRHRERE